MRWLLGLLMGLSFHSRFFTVAEITDETDIYLEKSPPLLMFSTPVPIEVGDQTVNVGGVGGLDTANPVLVIENSTDSSQSVVMAIYERLFLYTSCGENSFDCVVVISNVNYEVTFQKKGVEYKAVGGRGKITNSDFVLTVTTLATTPTADDLVTAFTKELMRLTDPPSELVKTLEITIDSSFDVIDL